MIPFAEWLPDLPVLENPGSPNVLNVKPHALSYKPHGSPGTYSAGALGARCQGAIGVLDDQATAYVYAGDATKLYQLNSTDLTWADVSRSSGGAYNVGSEESPGWRFQRAENKLIAVNIADDTQVIDLGGANFAALGGSPPKARYIANVRNRTVMGNTFDASDGNVPNRVRWNGLTVAGLADLEAWAISEVTTADFQDMPSEDGWVQAVVGGEYGRILQEKGISRMTFSGTSAVFQFDRVQGARGCFIPGSVALYDDVVFYIADDGFYAFDGVQSVPIGANKVDATFMADLDSTYWFRTTAAVDPINKLIYWAYPGSGNSNGTPNRVMIFDVVNRRWSPLSGFELELIFTAMTLGVSPDAIDALMSINGDTWPFSPDSRIWTGGKYQLAAMTTAHKLGFFDGANLAATLETTEATLFPGRRALVTGCRPLIDGGTVTITPVSRNLPGDSLTVGSAASVNANGLAPLRVDARYHRMRANIAAGGTWQHAQGCEVEARPTGRQ